MTNPGSTLLAVHLDRSSASRPLRAALRSGLADLLTDQAGTPGPLEVVVSTGDDPAADGPVADDAAADGGAPRPVTPVGAAEARTALPARLRRTGGPGLVTGTDRLLDAVGAELAARTEDERPERVVVLLVGATGRSAEDSSGSDALDALRARIEHQRRIYAWEFVLVDLAATTDAAGPADPVTPADGAATADTDAGDATVDTAAGDPAGASPAGAAAGTALAQRPDEPAAAARFGVPGTATVTAAPAAPAVSAAFAAASAFVGRARSGRPYEPVEGFSAAERAAAAAPGTRPAWRRLLGLS